MIRRITLQNYMSHEQTVIEPAAGLTVLVGPNNCGKSAIIHALQTLCYNKPNQFAIRHNQMEASVVVETDDGHVLKWCRRRNGSVSYEIDGQPTHRLGQSGVPDGLHSLLRMPKIESADGQAVFHVHFGLQKSPVFLLDDPPARAATFFASSSDAERLLQMQRRHREKVRDAKRDHAQISKEIENREEILAATAPITDLMAEVEKIEAAYALIEQTERQRWELAGHIARLKASRGKHDRHAAAHRAVAGLTAPPRYLEVSRITSILQQMVELRQRRTLQGRRSESLTSLDAPPTMHDTVRLSGHLSSLRLAVTVARQKSAKISRLASLEPPPAPPDLAPLSAAAKAIRLANQRIKNKTLVRSALEPLSAPPALHDTSRLREQIRDVTAAAAKHRQYRSRHAMLSRLGTPLESLAPERLPAVVARSLELRGSIQRSSRMLLTLRAQFENLREQTRRWVADNPQCPTCGASVDAELVLAGGHPHEQ